MCYCDACCIKNEVGLRMYFSDDVKTRSPKINGIKYELLFNCHRGSDGKVHLGDIGIKGVDYIIIGPHKKSRRQSESALCDQGWLGIYAPVKEK